MASSETPDEHQQASTRITLGVLNAVDGDRAVTQRRIAADLGIAVGLVNAYLKRCVNKGLIKVQQVPKRRYAYYLTPKGFAEKSRLTATYLRDSLDFFRQARSSCDEALGMAAARGWKSLVLIGRSDMAEIALVCTLHHPLRIVALVDDSADSGEGTFASLPLVANFSAVTEPFDGALITHIVDAQTAHDVAVAELGAARVLVPDILAQAIAAAKQSDGEA
ncbi:winged helix-turn-helix transcriptional regulator [Pelagibius marinus]|uniref:winged helix-turn-helix transcriptional regulator n=1 Tax=Pelagibius marinus TaxID=2762760 RepID=UPI00187281A5|nr:winged helix-turn-helix transcriptional regulator [Pelagibius marinus]